MRDKKKKKRRSESLNAAGMAKCYLLLYSEEKEEGRKDQEDKASFNFAPTEKEKYKNGLQARSGGGKEKKEEEEKVHLMFCSPRSVCPHFSIALCGRACSCECNSNSPPTGTRERIPY